MTKYNVELDPDFVGGKLNTAEFKDLPFLNDEELESLSTFVDAAASGKALIGRNKPSWTDSTHNELSQTESYKEHNFWHYHSGPTYTDARVRALTHNLGLNLDGITSAEVIHYTKEGNLVTVYGYSPEHCPFPRSDDPKKPHPLFHPDED